MRRVVIGRALRRMRPSPERPFAVLALLSQVRTSSAPTLAPEKAEQTVADGAGGQQNEKIPERNASFEKNPMLRLVGEHRTGLFVGLHRPAQKLHAPIRVR
jgi:hypothetical protein